MNSRGESKKKATVAGDPEVSLAEFIAKFTPAHAQLIVECRAELRQFLPGAIELVYDNYNFFVIGYSASERSSDCILSLAAAANGVGLSFYYGATLPDPDQLLQGRGSQNRFLRLPTVAGLRTAGVLTLIRAAVAQARTPLPAQGAGRTIIKSISAKQRPRRKT